MSLNDENNKNIHFGNKLILFGGDFRQILPVVKRDNRSSIVNASIKFSSFWKDVQKFHLTDNMCIKAAAVNNGIANSQLNAFANFLLTIGEGKHVVEPNTKYIGEILPPKNIASNLDEAQLIETSQHNNEAYNRCLFN